MTGNEWCQACCEAPAVEHRYGYDVCERCAGQADLPPYLRDAR